LFLDAYNTDHLHLTWIRSEIEDAVVPPDNKDMTEFSFRRLSFGESNITFEYPVTETFDQLNIKLFFKRNQAPYIIQMYLPCVMVVGLSWVGFWIEYRSAPARVSLGITTVLTMVTLGNSIRASIPFTQYSKSLDYYVMVCLFYVFAALLEFAVVGITDKKWKFMFKEQHGRESGKRNGYFRPKRKNIPTASLNNVSGIDLASLDNSTQHDVMTGQRKFSDVNNRTGVKTDVNNRTGVKTDVNNRTGVKSDVNNRTGVKILTRHVFHFNENNHNDILNQTAFDSVNKNISKGTINITLNKKNEQRSFFKAN